MKRLVEDPPSRLAHIQLESYVPFYLTAISNRWTASSSRVYLEAFGVGVVDWRILAALDAKTHATSREIAGLVHADPAAISRSIKGLERRGLLCKVAGTFPGRNRPYRMTDVGQCLCDDIRTVALRRERVLCEQLSSSDRETLITLLRKLYGQIQAL